VPRHKKKISSNSRHREEEAFRERRRSIDLEGRKETSDKESKEGEVQKGM